jgi:hypothetical protein
MAGIIRATPLKIIGVSITNGLSASDHVPDVIRSCAQTLFVRILRARFLTDTRKYQHITPVLRALHWLPVRQRIVFKIAMLVYKCLHNLAPPYLADELLPLESMPGRRRLRSVSNMELFIPRTRTVLFGPRDFAVCGPTIWNSLPSELRDPDLTISAFARKLKTFLFV